MSVDAYAEWAPGYPPHPHNALMDVEQAAMLKLLPSVRGWRVLDAGSGTGRYAQLLRARGATWVVGIDLSPAMLGRAAGCGWRVRGDVLALPIASEGVDLVMSGLVLPDVVDIDVAMQEWARVLRPGGLMVCSTLHPVGAVLGWTRTFDTASGQRSLPAQWHTIEDHRRACAAAGLAIETMTEASLSPPQPVALIVRARRVS